MRHTPVEWALLVVALTTSGCFDAHSRGAGDAGPGVDDAGDAIRDCARAAHAVDGAACDFEGACTGLVGTDCGPPSTIRCVEGRIRTLRPICTLPPPPRTCAEYLAAGVPGGPCDPAVFAGCMIPGDACCTRIVECRDGALSDETYCEPCGAPWCPAYVPPPPELTPCSERADCDPSTVCLGATQRDRCPDGRCRFPVRECESDASCRPGERCENDAFECSCGGDDSRCVLDCRLSESDPCEDGSRCGRDGLCEPISCSEGWSCAPNTRCSEPGVSGADEHGCRRIACDDADDCDCGVCLDDVCEDGPGACVMVEF